MNDAMTLQEYRERVRRLPRPTPAQRAAFANFVCGAQSWYKHLPSRLPGQPMYFYLDPSAGMDLRTDRHGRVTAAPRAERGPHYSWWPTKMHLERFGHLAYSQGVATRLHVVDTNVSAKFATDASLTMFDAAAGCLRTLPTEVAAAGQSLVTRFIDNHMANQYVGLHRLPDDFEWPAASGGAQTLAAIRERSRLLSDGQTPSQGPTEDERGLDPEWPLNFIDMPLYRLLEPERRRQRQGMVEAIDRMLRLID